MKSATRRLIATFGGFVGLMGIEHGIGEILQGNIPPDGVFILSWPHSDFFRVLAGEPAMTVLPNLFITGVLAVLISLLYLIWAILFVERKHGGLVLMLITVPMLLFGGGLFPPLIGMLIGAAATRINAPLTWWKRHLSAGFQDLMVRLWPWFYGACLLAWLAMFPGMPILEFFFGVDNANLVMTVLACMFGFLFLAGLAGIARDIQRQPGAAA